MTTIQRLAKLWPSGMDGGCLHGRPLPELAFFPMCKPENFKDIYWQWRMKQLRPTSYVSMIPE